MPRPFANWRQKLGVGGSNKHTAYEAKPTDETGGEDNSPVPVTEETPLVSSQTVSFEKDQQEVPASNSVRFAQNGEDVYGQGGVFSDSIRSISERISEFARQLSEAVEEHTGSIGYLVRNPIEFQQKISGCGYVTPSPSFRRQLHTGELCHCRQFIDRPGHVRAAGCVCGERSDTNNIYVAFCLLLVSIM